MANHLLLLDVAPADEVVIRETLSRASCQIDTATLRSLAALKPSFQYDLILSGIPPTEDGPLANLLSLKGGFRDCLLVFLLRKPDHDLTKRCYLIGDGAIEFPMESEKLLRVFQWYFSSGKTRHLETVKENRPLLRTIRLVAGGSKGLFWLVLLLTLLSGAIIGLFFTDKLTRDDPVDTVPLNTLKGVIHELRK